MSSWIVWNAFQIIQCIYIIFELQLFLCSWIVWNMFQIILLWSNWHFFSHFIGEPVCTHWMTECVQYNLSFTATSIHLPENITLLGLLLSLIVHCIIHYMAIRIWGWVEEKGWQCLLMHLFPQNLGSSQRKWLMVIANNYFPMISKVKRLKKGWRHLPINNSTHNLRLRGRKMVNGPRK